MTKQEAISILETNAINATGTLGGLPQTAAEKSSLNQQIEALDMAIEALEKQIPKKPVSKYKYRYGKTVCPACETENTCRIVMFWEKYCPDCGQAIDYGEVKE